jgi:hypothetical protein
VAEAVASPSGISNPTSIFHASGLQLHFAIQARHKTYGPLSPKRAADTVAVTEGDCSAKERVSRHWGGQETLVRCSSVDGEGSGVRCGGGRVGDGDGCGAGGREIGGGDGHAEVSGVRAGCGSRRAVPVHRHTRD